VSGEFKRIRDAEIYLDMRNIFSAYKAETAPPYEQEYRDLAKEASVEHLEEINAIKNTKIDFDPKFRMVNDLVRKFRKNHQDDSDINANLVAHLNTIATIEIKNFAGQSPSPNLAFKTFIDLTSAELTRTATNLTCQFEDGMVVLGSMPEDLIKMAISTLDRLDAFNKLVDKSEIIKLRITLHYSAIPFMEFENQGLKEFRKIIKIHNLDLKYARKASQIESGPNGHELMLTDSVVQNFKINGLAKLGEFRLPYFPQKHEIYQLDLANRNRPPIATPPETEPAPQARPRPQNIISKSPQAEPKTALKPLPDSESQPETEAGVEDLAPEGENNDFDAELEPQSEVQLGDETPSEEAAHPGHNGVLRQFGKYEAVRTFGENSLYTTYHGYDPHLERSVVIKAYESNAFAGFKDFDPLRKQFYEEVRKLNRINHPNIGVIYDAGEVDKTLYFVREFVEGTGINKFLRDNKIAQINEILDLYVKVCRIVSLYHQGHIWHKNLKPENVLVTDQKEIKLMDGGLLQVNNSEEVVDVDTGHICYLAPEQVRGRRLTQTCDVYQIGGLIYESLTGLNPFWAETPLETRMKIISEDPVAPSAYRIEIPEALDNIITRCLNKNPDKRYRNIGELESELRRLSASFQSDSKKRVFDIF
jgi:tRNA A-37 threonylcarbamoyl transferase component Bud32